MKKNVIVVLGIGLILAGCSGQHATPNFEAVQDMMESPAIKAQEYDEESPGQAGMRVPPQNTVPQGFAPYKYGLDVEKASKENKNPIAGQNSEDILLAGQKYYGTQCLLCHGQQGQGGEQGNSIGDLMARKPPSLLSDRVVGMSDGQIYHIITMGQGMMGPYASHIPQAYRWQVVNYIRELQKRSK